MANANWIETYNDLDLMLKRCGVKHFTARELTRPTKSHGVINGPVPRSLMDNMCALVWLLELIRTAFGNHPVIVTSGYRTPAYNRAVGGESGSYHTKGMAADIVIPGVKPKQVFDWMDATYPHKYGRGRYRTFTHVDVRPKYERWWDL